MVATTVRATQTGIMVETWDGMPGPKLCTHCVMLKVMSVNFEKLCVLLLVYLYQLGPGNSLILSYEKYRLSKLSTAGARKISNAKLTRVLVFGFNSATFQLK